MGLKLRINGFSGLSRERFDGEYTLNMIIGSLCGMWLAFISGLAIIYPSKLLVYDQFNK